MTGTILQYTRHMESKRNKSSLSPSITEQHIVLCLKCVSRDFVVYIDECGKGNKGRFSCFFCRTHALQKLGANYLSLTHIIKVLYVLHSTVDTKILSNPGKPHPVK